MSLCPWNGLPCACGGFPWTWNGIVPKKCENAMPDELLGHRKVSAAGKARHQAYLDELEMKRRT